MIENLKKKVFHLFLGISLKRRLFITYLLLSSLILMLTSVFFYTASKKVLIKRAALSSQQQLSLITSNLGEKIDNISNYAITLSINSNIADVLKENPTVPENTLEHFLVNSELTDQAQRIIGLHKNIYAWDILDTENHWFHSSTTETDQLDSILGPEVLDSLQTNLAFHFLGPFQISGEPTFVALKSITNIDNTKYLGALVLLIRETNISSAFRDLPDSSSRDFYITDENGQILIKHSVPTYKERPTDEIVADMASLAKKLIAESGLNITEFSSVGIGCPGTIDSKSGEVVYSNNIPMEHYPMAQRFKEHLNLPVIIDNDANCAALGEYTVNGNEAKVFILITLGTGVGSGVIINGKIFHGFNGAAAELGHITLVSGGKKCTCGKEGCLESYASATALIEQTKVAMSANNDSIMHEIAKNEGEVSGRTAFDAAKQGDNTAIEVVNNYARYLADGLVSIENAFQPEVIAIGGGISKESEYLLKPVREYVQNNGFNKYMKKTEIVAAKLFNDAGIIGAAML